MIKFNLITKGEQQRLNKLREAHQMYLDNFKPNYQPKRENFCLRKLWLKGRGVAFKYDGLPLIANCLT